ncbi:3-hydroxyacyl-CoA dehydrogenase family protein [Microbacterium sp. AK031]|uniref:3-hydroxyacyl-CoA dehydrogenase family protein n=1 Tax=Microbacterium sp. AK031 TaxID=2723076 RepID=UPI002167FCCC|nr:3-hydroxyacyl-CoA dehydrogenase family protein [Microbacterium sp. AK031]MCS3843257.1 3-hydroxybutyryl-CoA dehydrogenase [Microbacterium sp. AK031]
MKVGILGGGRMGAGIAHAFLTSPDAASRHDVVVVERDEELRDAAAQRIRESLSRSIDRGVIDGSLEEAISTLRASTDIQDFADCDLVIEAVPEDRALKSEALALVESVLSEDAALASNTSSISIEALAASLMRPQNFLGLHFFNPVPSSSLVEVVSGSATDPALIERARGWVEALGKTPIVVRDAPGFASSRLGLVLALEAIRMLDAGVASAEDIDRAMELGYRHPMGPLRTTDVVGLDVRLGIAEELYATLGERFAPPALLRQMVADGRLGRKSGEGFYRWDDA